LRANGNVMEMANALTYLFPIILGVSLGASTGLHTTLPLLLTAAAAHFHWGHFALRGDFAWLESDTALIVLLIAAVLETIADKVPAIDHALDVVGTFARPVAATLAAAAVFGHGDKTTAAIVGLIVGAPAAFGVHAAKAGLRVGSSATTFGCANPFISLAEDGVAATLSLAAIFAPLLALVVLVILALLCARIIRKATMSSRA
jgi:uncharacterized protein DUF4126